MSMTVIAKGVTLEGKYHGQGDVTVEGEVQGSLETSGSFTLGSEARVQGDVLAAQASIAGSVVGNVRTTGALELKSTARIEGDITAAAISIESGAKLSGRIAIGGLQADNAKAALSSEPAIVSMDVKV